MMMGAVPTSIPQMILAGNWLLEGNFKKRIATSGKINLIVLLVSFFALYLIGLTYTQDLSAGLNELKIKLPFLALPLIFLSSEALTKKELQLVFSGFLLGTLTNTLWCITYTHILHYAETIRDASRFMSHIRLGLYLNMAIGVTAYLFVNSSVLWKKISLLILALYFIACFYILGLASGFLIFILFGFTAVLVFSFYYRSWWSLLAVFVLIVSCAWYVALVAKKQIQINPGYVNTPQQKTPWGSNYIHMGDESQLENGNYIFYNIELQEIRRVWNRRVPEDSFSYNPAYNLQRYENLLRYITSQGKTKDSLAVQQLSDLDIENIKKGIPNYQYNDWSFFHRRVYELVNEYENLLHAKKINGNSVTMRPFFWKAALHAIAQHPLTGAGTGDIQSEMNAAYKAIQSPLSTEWHKRPHNQFLSTTLAFGLLGLLLLLAMLVLPGYWHKSHLHPLYWLHLAIVIVSFLAEDTLDTQAGQNFYLFFTCLFLAAVMPHKKNYDPQKETNS